MSLSTELLDILRCPESKEELIYFPHGDGDGVPFLLCPASRLRYRIDQHGIPVMLIEEAERLEQDACSRMVERARELGLSVPGN